MRGGHKAYRGDPPSPPPTMENPGLNDAHPSHIREVMKFYNPGH